MEALARHSSWFVHQLVTVIPRLAGVPASECKWMWVWELQERGALHWHGVFQFPDHDHAKTVIARFKGLWCQLIDSVSARSGVDLAQRLDGGTHSGDYEVWRIDAQIALKSPSQYLAKYLSKDASKTCGAVFFFPTRWYGCSRSILSAMREQTMHFSTEGDSVFPGQTLSDKDANLLGLLRSQSSFSASWKGLYSDDWTFVFYFEDSVMANVISTLSSASAKAAPVAKKPEKWKPVPGSPSPYVVWPAIDKVLAWPVLSERLFLDIGAHYQGQLNLYRRGLPSVWGDVYWVNRHAEYLLYLQGVRSGVNSGSAPVGGLTPNASKTLGQEWGAEQLSLLSGLPF
jgi:hypothetical protein